MLDSVLTEQCGEGAPYTDVQDNRRIWRGQGRPQRASPLLRHPDLSHPALYAFSSVFCLTATPWKPHPSLQDFGANTENTVPCTQTFGLLLRTWPQTGPQ